MKKVVIGKLKKKEYKGLKRFFKKIVKKSLVYWVGEINGKEFSLVWDPNKKIDDTFNEKKVGFEFVYLKRKQSLNVVTFYPEVFRKMYPQFVD